MGTTTGNLIKMLEERQNLIHVVFERIKLCVPIRDKVYDTLERSVHSKIVGGRTFNVVWSRIQEGTWRVVWNNGNSILTNVEKEDFTTYKINVIKELQNEIPQRFCN
jgi:hypothetical protein